VLLARLAQLHAHVDEARCEALAVAVDDLADRGRAVLEQVGTKVRDDAVLDKKRATGIETRGWVEQPRVEIGDPLAAHGSLL